MIATCAFLMLSMMAPGAVVLLPPPDAIGVDDAEVLDITTTVSKAVLKTTGAPPLVDDPLPASCTEDAACLTTRLSTVRADGLLLLSIIRSGDALDVRERLWLRDGSLAVDVHRTATFAAFTASPLSAEVASGLAALPPSAPPAASAPETAPPSPVPSWVTPLAVTTAGGGLAVLGGTALGVAAAVVADPASLGRDKESAYVVGWSGVVVGGLGVVTALAGGAWTVLAISPTAERVE